MAGKREYRSAVRSRKLIRQAFIDLLREKEFEKITVTDIVSRADINRSTFYAHYPDVRGLVEELEEEAVRRSQEMLPLIRDKSFFTEPEPFLKSMEMLITENAELYRLLGRSNFAVRQVEKMKVDFVEQTLRFPDLPEKLRSSGAFRVRIHFFIGGVLNTYLQWLQGQLDCPLEAVTAEIAALITGSASDILQMEL